ncbi:MAG: ABC transporter permease subunit [Clostridia bacterium]|nr:ABC transporter permease subunit [Clostridia bacterium]
MRAKLRRPVVGIGVAAFWLCLWLLCSLWVGQELLLPTPILVAQTLWRLMGTTAFWVSVGLSLLRVLGGFAAAVVAGILLAMLTTRFRTVHALLSPVLHVIQAAPVASFIIMAYVWIQVGILPAFIAFLMVVPLVWSNVRQGILNTDPKLLEMASVFRLGRRRTMRYVRFPSVRPYLEAALTAGFGFAWKSGIAAEVICQPDWSIGQNMYAAKAYLETAEVIAWTVVVVLLSVLLERLLLRLFGRKKQEVRE